MELFFYSIGSLALAGGGLALMKLTHFLSSLYDLKSEEVDEQVTMEPSSIMVWSVWLAMKVFAIVFHTAGGIMLAFGVIQFIARLLRLGTYAAD
jgi:hypothetical protein